MRVAGMDVALKVSFHGAWINGKVIASNEHTKEIALAIARMKEIP